MTINRLAFIFALTPTALLAEVCDKERPDWAVGYGQASALDEVFVLFGATPSLIAIAVTFIALLAQMPLLVGIASILWGAIAIAAATHVLYPDDIYVFAVLEGCIGPPHAAIGLCTLLCAFTAFWALRLQKSAPTTPE